MNSPDPTSEEAVQALSRQPDEPNPGPAVGTSPEVAPTTAGQRGRGLRDLLQPIVEGTRRAGRTGARKYLGPAYQRGTRKVRDRIGLMVRDAVAGDPAVVQVRTLSERGAFDRASETERADRARTDRVNLELLKGEVRHLEHRLEELGMAFAPGTGLDGAGARFAELREAVHALERRMRNVSLPAGPVRADTFAEVPAEVPAEAPPGPAPDQPRLSSTLFDYVGFERRFRGDPDEVLDTLVERYGDDLIDHQPVVDVGCGRGELLGRLAERDAHVIGIEPDPGMASEARARGIEVHEELAGPWLRSVPDHSLGSIITTHVLEHLELDDLIELLELAVTKLKPGGVFISETPNPASLIVLGNSYLLDPTHVRPLHPSLLSFLCENAGFRDVRLRFFSPAEGYHLSPIPVTEAERAQGVDQVAEHVNTAFERLNTVLFGPQDFAVVARTP